MGEGCEGYPPKEPLSLLQRLPGVEGPPEGSLKALVAVISQLERLSEASQGGPYVMTATQGSAATARRGTLTSPRDKFCPAGVAECKTGIIYEYWAGRTLHLGMPFRVILNSNAPHSSAVHFGVFLQNLAGIFCIFVRTARSSSVQARPCFARQRRRFEEATSCTVKPASAKSQLAKRHAALR